MSALETLYILFKSFGTDDVKKAQEEVKKSADKMNESLKDSEKVGDKVTESFSKLGKELTNTITKVISVGALLAGIKNSINYAEDVDLASRQLAVNVDELDAWDNAVRRTGGTAEQFQASLRRLAQQLGTSGQIALEVLPQLADSFQQMGRFGAIRYGEILGLDENTILLLQKGRREVEEIIKQQKELGVVSKIDAERAREFNFAWQDATHQLRTNFLILSQELLPTLIKITNFAAVSFGFLAEHSDLVKGALLAIGGAALFAKNGILKLGLAMLRTKGMTGLLIGALALAYEDIDYFAKGYDSYIGRLLKEFPILQREVAAFIRLFRDLKDAGSWFNNTVDNAANSVYQKLFGKKEQSQSSSGNGFALSVEDIARIQSSKLDHVKKVLDIATSSSISYTKPSDLQKYAIPSAHKSVSVNTGPVTVNTQATDGQGTARAFGNYLTDQITQANNYFDDGVKI